MTLRPSAPLAPPALLPEVIDAVAEAGRMVAAEFGRPSGPRMIDHVTAPVDTEIELFLRARLMALVPARFVGEEAGVVAAPANGLCWVVDPHDGTRAFLEGKRGSAVSVALLRHGTPVLGVVYAPLSPDRGQDMIAWAEGTGITRNGDPVTVDLRQRDLAAHDVVFLNHGVWQRPVWNSLACAPARFLPLPSIAYRLARIAVGDGIATQTLRPVNALDIAAGHALLTAAGGILLAEDGTPVTYSTLGESRPSACFGGAPAAVATLLSRAWRGSTEDRRLPRIVLNWPRVPESTALDRAAGTLLGLAIGDSMGAQVEGMAAPPPLDGMRDGGVWNTLAGQPTDDTELALALGRTLAGRDLYDQDAVADAYQAWFASDPFGLGPTTTRALVGAAAIPGPRAAALRQAADPESLGNGSLMRIAPVGIWARNPVEAATVAAADSRLTHPHPDCIGACAALAAAIAAAIRLDADRPAMLAAARAGATGRVAATVDQAAAGQPPADDAPVLTALHNAFRHLAAGTGVAEAILATIAAGGDTDTNAAIVGALLGAADGRRALPTGWVMPVLTCRPDHGLTAAGLAVARPRPDMYWTDDLIDLAEALLLRPSRTGLETA